MSDPNIILYPISRIIRDYLIEQGVGFTYATSTDWAIATEARPKKPFNAITIYTEAETKQYRSSLGGVQDAPGVTIEVRSTQPEPGQYQAKLIMQAMDALSRWEWEGDSTEYAQTVTIAIARRVRGIFNLGMDDNGRHLFNLEYGLVIQSITE